MSNIVEVFKSDKTYQFLKRFIMRTVNELNNEYNMSFIKFIFKEEDLDAIGSKLNLESPEVRQALNTLKRNVREYENRDSDEEFIYLKIDDSARFFQLLSRIYDLMKVANKKENADSLMRSLWLRMGTEDINDVNKFLEQQLNFLYGDRFFDGRYCAYQTLGDYKLVYEDISNTDSFETFNHIELSLINSDHKTGIEKVKYSFPVVHYGINYENGEPVCYIYGVQNLENQRKDEEVSEFIKAYKKPLRNGKVSPEFVLTLKFFIDIINSRGITNIKVPLLQVYNYQYHEYLSKALDRDYADYTDEEKEKYDAMEGSEDLSDSALCYLFTKKGYERFVDKEDIISKNKTERFIDTFIIMEEKYHNIEFLNEPFIEGDTLLIKIKSEEKAKEYIK